MMPEIPDPSPMTGVLKLHKINPKKLINRINDSFDENNQEQMLKYMDWLRSTILDYIQSIRRNITVLLLFVVVFELVIDSRNTTFIIGSFHITKGSIVLVFLPSAVSYLYYHALLETIKTSQLRMAFHYIFEKWSADAADNGLINLLYGPEPIHWSTYGVLDDDNIDNMDRLEYRSRAIFGFVVSQGVLAFEVQSYWALFPAHNAQVAAWVVSLFITIVCLILSMSLAVLSSRRFRDDEYRPVDGKHRREVPSL